MIEWERLLIALWDHVSFLATEEANHAMRAACAAAGLEVKVNEMRSPGKDLSQNVQRGNKAPGVNSQAP